MSQLDTHENSAPQRHPGCSERVQFYSSDSPNVCQVSEKFHFRINSQQILQNDTF